MLNILCQPRVECWDHQGRCVVISVIKLPAFEPQSIVSQILLTSCPSDLIESKTIFEIEPNGWTPLHYAAKRGQLEICELLIQHDANVNVKDNLRRTPLHRAASWGYLEICELLIKHGADVNTKDKYKWTQLHFATSWGHLEICELLIQHGADVNAISKHGWMPLYEAAKRRHLEICEVLFINQAVMDIDSLSTYRNYVDSQLKYCFRYFESKTDEELFDILTQKNATIRLFVKALIHNEVMPLFDQRDRMMDPYACDLLYLNRRYPDIRPYLEGGFGFQTVRWTKHAYLTRYRFWLKRWRYNHRRHVKIPPLIPTFNHRLTQNIRYGKTK